MHSRNERKPLLCIFRYEDTDPFTVCPKILSRLFLNARILRLVEILRHMGGDLILTFVITAVWDVILRLFSEQKLRFFGIHKWKWVVALRPYFERHTLLAAALLAGVVGAIAYACITLPPFYDTLSPLVKLVWIIAVSGGLGIPMRYSGLFPHLKTYYYDHLGFLYSLMTDILSIH